MTGEIILLGRARNRCAVCGGRYNRINPFGMCNDGDGRDFFVHLDCMPTWAAWQLTICAVCDLADRPDDPIFSISADMRHLRISESGGSLILHRTICQP